MIKSINEVSVSSITKNGVITEELFEEKPVGCIKVESHWNDNKKVIIRIDNDEYEVNAKDMVTAIENATNVSRWGR